MTPLQDHDGNPEEAARSRRFLNQFLFEVRAADLPGSRELIAQIEKTLRQLGEGDDRVSSRE